MQSHPRPEDPLLQHLQEKAFAYFKHETNPCTGLVRDKNAPHWPADIAALGLALASYPVAVEAPAIVDRAIESPFHGPPH